MKRIQQLKELIATPGTMETLRIHDKPFYLVLLDHLNNKEQAEKLHQQLLAANIENVTRQHKQVAEVSSQTSQSIKQTKPISQSRELIRIPVKETSTESIPLTSSEKEKRLWNLRGADIRSVIEEVSKETGKNFLIDPRVQGKISIISSTPMGSKEIYQVFLSMLQVAGFSAVPSGEVIKIMPDSKGKTASSPVVNNLHRKQGDEIIVRVIPIKYVSALQLVPILRPLLPQWSHIAAYVPSNTLILSGHAANLNRLVEIIRRVDTATHNAVDLIPLHNALAEDVVKTIKTLREGQRNLNKQPLSIAADGRSNSILISGGHSERLRMRVLISQLDIPSPSGTSGNTQIVYLQYLKAQDLVPIIAGVARSQFRGEVGTLIGKRTVDTATKLERITTPGEESYQASPESVATQSETAKSTDSTKPRVEIIAEPNTNAIILNAPPVLMRTLKTVIAKLDIRPAQVLIEALIVEIDEDDINQLGIDWGTLLDDTRIISGTSLAKNTFIPGFGIINEDGFDTFEAQLTALASNRKANILSTPSVVVLDNNLAHIKVGKEVSIITSNYPNNAGATTAGSPYNTFDRRDVALILNVTPQITRNNEIKLTIAHQNNTLQNPQEVSDRPIFNISEIKTSVIVNAGNILVLGGLIQNQLSDTDRRIPIIGDFPGLGQIFHKKSLTRTKKKLLVFIRPLILHDKRDNLRVSGSKYETIREEQLTSVRTRPYHQDYNEYILPALHKPLKLPKPFSHYRIKQRRT